MGLEIWAAEERLIDELKGRLSDSGFTALTDDYQPEVFGNRLIDLARPPVLVRLVRDRSQWSIDVAGPDGRLEAVER